MKPFLADGTLHFVGALTNFNFAKYIESDPSLSCHFQQVYSSFFSLFCMINNFFLKKKVAVEEATIEKTVDILKVLRPRLEGHHHVTLLDEALVTASTLSSRFLSDRYLPEKAITLIDTVCFIICIIIIIIISYHFLLVGSSSGQFEIGYQTRHN